MTKQFTLAPAALGAKNKKINELPFVKAANFAILLSVQSHWDQGKEMCDIAIASVLCRQDQRHKRTYTICFDQKIKIMK